MLQLDCFTQTCLWVVLSIELLSAIPSLKHCYFDSTHEFLHDINILSLGVYFEINGKVYLNNSAIPLVEVGEGESALYCKTDKELCCGTPPNVFREFYYPNGVQVPVARQQQGFYRNRGEQIIRLNRREGITSPTGRYQCEIPNADDMMVKLYITLTE